MMNDNDFAALRDMGDAQRTERWLCFDPGTFKTGWVIFDPHAETVLDAGWDKNDDAIEVTECMGFHDRIIMETFAAQGMPLGSSSLETVRFEGMLIERAAASRQIVVDRITRREIKLTLCGTSRAKDQNVRAALVDLYASDWVSIGNGLGVKSNPSPLAKLRACKGAAAHTFAALAVATAWRAEHWSGR